MDAPLIKDFVYDVPVAKVWRALTDADQMRRWYFPQLQKFEAVAGRRFEFEDTDSEFQKEWIVTEVETGKLLAHSWAYKGYPGQSEVKFELSALDQKTKLRVTQTGLESFPKDAHFKRERFEWGWENLLGKNLKTLLEKN